MKAKGTRTVEKSQTHGGEHGFGKGLDSQDVALISVFAALWIASQITLGPVIGSISLGPVSLHGTVNRVAGWMLMLVLADITGRFGRVTLMASVASLATRMIRLSALTGFIVGIGYALGGLVFDALIHGCIRGRLDRRSCWLGVVTVAVISGFMASVPYLFFKFMVLGMDAFLVLSPVYLLSTAKGIFFSVIGIMLGLSIIPRINSTI